MYENIKLTNNNSMPQYELFKKEKKTAKKLFNSIIFTCFRCPQRPFLISTMHYGHSIV